MSFVFPSGEETTAMLFTMYFVASVDVLGEHSGVERKVDVFEVSP